jgi:hypothetical protein
MSMVWKDGKSWSDSLHRGGGRSPAAPVEARGRQLAALRPGPPPHHVACDLPLRSHVRERHSTQELHPGQRDLGKPMSWIRQPGAVLQWRANPDFHAPPRAGARGLARRDDRFVGIERMEQAPAHAAAEAPFPSSPDPVCAHHRGQRAHADRISVRAEVLRSGPDDWSDQGIGKGRPGRVSIPDVVRSDISFVRSAP